MAFLFIMVYHAIGLMSGSSLDGLDIAFVKLEERSGIWRYEWIATDCIAYDDDWMARLRSASSLSVPEFLKLHTAYGHLTGKLIQEFLHRHAPNAAVDFIASHGHTAFHEPHNATTWQIGDGASIAAETGIPVISDLRSVDVAFGGQGAPIVPIGDKLLFGEYEYLLNLGGIANVSIQSKAIAFDICPCNQLLNYYAAKLGKEYDEGGNFARSGNVDDVLQARLAVQEYYGLKPPKSLANEFSTDFILPEIENKGISPCDALATCVAHIVSRISSEVQPFVTNGSSGKLLATGGGVFNTFLLERLRASLAACQIEVVVPERRLVQFKEALIMALIGVLRWRKEPNVLSSVTGAKRDSIGGAIWESNQS